MNFVEYLQSYSDVSQIIRGLYLIQELALNTSVSVSKFLLETSKSTERLGFYKDIVSYLRPKLSHFDHNLEILDETSIEQ